MPMQQIDPAVYDEILNLGQGIGNIDPEIAQQQEIAKRLRLQSAMPQGAVMSGRIASRPSIFQYLNSLYGGQVAQGKEQKAYELMQQQNALRQQQVAALLRALKMQQTPPVDSNIGPQLGY